MIILSFDLASSTGYAIFDNSELLEVGTLSFPLKKKEHVGKRYLSVITEYADLIERVNPDVIVYEDVVRHSSSQAAHLFGYYRGVMYGLAASNNINVFGYVPTYWKKFIIGNGKADKETVQNYVKLRFPDIHISNFDESDAVCIGLTYIQNQTSI